VYTATDYNVQYELNEHCKQQQFITYNMG